MFGQSLDLDAGAERRRQRRNEGRVGLRILERATRRVERREPAIGDQNPHGTRARLSFSDTSVPSAALSSIEVRINAVAGVWA